MQKRVDFLVIGSGIAGMSFALKVAEQGTVCMVVKGTALDTATNFAQGGIAAVMYNPDSYEKHIQDTLIAGDNLNNKEIVEMTICESTDRVAELIAWGTDFDLSEDGRFELGKEGGHSENRVLHHKDNTGAEIQQKLLQEVLKHPNIEILENHFAIDLITQHHLGEIITRDSKNIACYGAYVLNLITGQMDVFLSKITMIASGGSGNVYKSTTNPEVATGDGVAMVSRANGLIENMEFFQFHPTALYNPGETPSFLITEALRGFGAILRNHRGEDFMKRYDSRGNLAPRDIVARSIDNEMKVAGCDYLFLDCSHLDKQSLKSHFPNITAKAIELGVDIANDWIPIVPAAHYQCGGIKVDAFARSTINRLYASGECASTGLHGANRLASNSLLEALVFSHRAAQHALSVVNDISIQENIPEWNDEGTTFPEEMVLITQNLKELRMIMSDYVGIVRTDLRLKRAMDRLEIIYKETEKLYERSVVLKEICELRNLIKVAYLIIKMARKRKESRGLHFSLDYPPITK